ncbi:MAG: glycosyltransferase [Candidatus Omnitrophota bacterium]
MEPIKYRGWEQAESMRFQELSENKIPENMKIIRRKSGLKKSLLFLFYENWKNCRLIKKHKPEAVISNDIVMSAFSCIYAKIKKIKFLFNVLDDLEAMESKAFMKLYLRFIAIPVIGRFSSAVITLSHEQCEKYKRYNENTFHVPNGKSIEYIDEAKKYSQVPPKNEVNFVGCVRKDYDFDLVLETFGEFPQLKLNIYGDGPLYDYVLERSKEYKNISIFGSVSSTEIPRLMAESLFGIIPLAQSRKNRSTSPTKLFDYWAAKKAVIATPNNEIKVSAGDCVLYVQNKKDFVDAVNRLLNDEALREKLASMSFKKITEVYNYDKIGKKIEDIIKKL